MRRYRIHLAIPRSEMEDYYSGRASVVHAVTENGLSVQFPARILRSYLDQRGVHGTFELVTDQDHRLQEFRRLDRPS
ncbi:MAG: DUF2835 family protein [Pseudomonadota bacterium]